jgi:RHS repeat-associated protein
VGNKSQTANSAIALPQGGGAVRGIGNNFTPDLQTGTGNYTVPIELPAGRNGFQPELSLVYSSGFGNGVCGVGWKLGVSGEISRQTSHFIPTYNNSTDIFVLSGLEDLVPVSVTEAGAIRYRPRTEGLFAHIDHHQNRGDYWEVLSRDGLVSVYGTPSDAEILDPSIVADPAERSRIFAWHLTRSIDPFGNCIEYVYERDPLCTDGPHHWDQVYISEMRYVDHGARSSPDFIVHVKFVYEPRPDAYSEYRSGFEIRTVRRCARIEVYTHADKNLLTRTYNLIYLDQERELAFEQPPNGISLLRRIRVEGHDGPATQSLAPLEFSYTAFDPARQRYQVLSGINEAVPERSLASPDFELVDLFGDGLPDVVQMNTVARYWRNRGGGEFDLPRTMERAPIGVGLAETGVQVADMDGDGRPDLLVLKGERGGYFTGLGNGWDQGSYVRYPQAPTINLEDPETRLVDLNGDGVVDALRTGPTFELFYNDRFLGWERVELRPRGDPEQFPNVWFSDPRVKIADMTGDGLQDIVVVNDGRVEYWPYLGDGRWGERITMRNSPQFYDDLARVGMDYDPARVLLGDVDGDGCSDIVYVGPTSITVWINQCGNGWSDPVCVHGTPPITVLDAVRLSDMLGTGTNGILWTYDFNIQRDSTYKFLDLTGGSKPYLLQRIDNNMGAITRIEYAPSTRFYLEDEKKPETRWKTELPFPVQVVARVELLEFWGGMLTTEYSYHDGCWDGVEREFRGFGRVDQRDTEVFERFHRAELHQGSSPAPVPLEMFSPATESRTWFHLGPVSDGAGDWGEVDWRREFWAGDPPVFSRTADMDDALTKLSPSARRDALRALRGRVLRTELYSFDGAIRENRPYTVTEYLHAVTPILPGPPESDQSSPSPHSVFFPHVLAERTTQWDRGNDPMTRFMFTGKYDLYGQPTSQINIAVPRGRDFRSEPSIGSDPEPYVATHVVTTFAQRDDVNRYIVDRVARATTYEIPNDGRVGPADAIPKLLDFAVQIADYMVPHKILGQSLYFYDGNAYEGLSFGRIGDYGALVRATTLAMTDQQLDEAYGNSGSAPVPASIPPYLLSAAAPVWSTEYPEEFRASLSPLAGYELKNGAPGSEYAPGYFIISERMRYDFHENLTRQGLGLVVGRLDALGRETTISYDTYGLCPKSVHDPAGLVTTAEYDYRVLRPREVTDPNHNRSLATYTPLGLLETLSVMGKKGQAVGDVTEPGSAFAYDLEAFAKRRAPASVWTTRRVHHTSDATIQPRDRDAKIVEVQHSDGFGRVLQTRVQTDDVLFGDPDFGDSGLDQEQVHSSVPATGRRPQDPDRVNVVVSGARLLDNKGRIVVEYQPYFSSGLDYLSPNSAQMRVGVRTYYDPLGRRVRSSYPDGSEERVLYGVPGTIAAPDVTNPSAFEPTPWERYTYDASDNGGRTHPLNGAADQSHWDTPSSAEVDALGRIVRLVERNGADPRTDWYTTTSAYDVRGNLLKVTDALGRDVMRNTVDAMNRLIRSEKLDGGVWRTVFNAAGSIVEERDRRGALRLHVHDVLNRPTRLWARDTVRTSITLRQRREYGDGSSPDQALATRSASRALNLLGRLVRQYDEAGLHSYEQYDFKGNVVQTNRRVISDGEITRVFASAAENHWRVQVYRVDWDTPLGTSLAAREAALLSPTEYRITNSYDALNRVQEVLYPQDLSGTRRVLHAFYGASGRLRCLEMDGETYVSNVAYNAKGQRLLIVYGNGFMTRYAYDPLTSRLARLRTERFVVPAGEPLRYQPRGAPLQDFHYTFDLTGNLVGISDRTPGCGVPNSALGKDAIDRTFSYDPLYRLVYATGRECAVTPSDPWEGQSLCDDVTRTRGYVERYFYDSVGNLKQQRHLSAGRLKVENFSVRAAQNQLSAVLRGSVKYKYEYDANGNLVRENGERHFEWDHDDRLSSYRRQTRAPGTRADEDKWSPPSEHANYLYDAAGQRVVKFVRKQGAPLEITVYVGGLFEHFRVVGGGKSGENNTLHVIDRRDRIALRRVGPGLGDSSPAVTYSISDHLGSSNIVLAATGGFINREDWGPWGDPRFGSYSKKRYRFAGKERDEESGLNYHGARYYAPWLRRWMSVDPKGLVDGTNPYVYVRNSPLSLVDPTGEYADSTGEYLRQAAPAAGAAAGAVKAGAAGTGVGLGIAAGVLALATGWLAFWVKADQNAAEKHAERQRRSMHADDLRNAGQITDEQREQYVLTGFLTQADRQAAEKAEKLRGDAFRKHWTGFGRQFQEYVLETKLKHLQERGILEVDFEIGAEKFGSNTTVRKPDFAVRSRAHPGLFVWVGDAKFVEEIKLDAQMKAFIAEAARTTQKLLLLFTPDESSRIPKSVTDAADAAGIKVIEVPVPFVPEWLPELHPTGSQAKQNR